MEFHPAVVTAAAVDSAEQVRKNIEAGPNIREDFVNSIERLIFSVDNRPYWC